MLYRTDGERRWHEGVTVNLSAGGALIDGDAPGSGIETVVVVIPLLTSDGCFTGRGRVVRTADAGTGHGRFALAIDRYHLGRQAAALAQLDTLHQEC